MEGREISPAMRAVLGQVFINMPWNYIEQYIDLVIANGINIEIGFGADELEKSSAGAVGAVVGRMREKGSRITFHGPFWDLCSGSVDPGIRKVTVSRLESLFDVVERSGRNRLSVIPVSIRGITGGIAGCGSRTAFRRGRLLLSGRK